MDERAMLIYKHNGKNTIIEEGTKKWICYIPKICENKEELAKRYKISDENIGEFIISDENNKKIEIIFNDEMLLLKELISDNEFIEYVYKKYRFDISEYEKYPLEIMKKKKLIINIYRNEYKKIIKIQQDIQETEFMGSLLDNSKVKKLGGM